MQLTKQLRRNYLGRHYTWGVSKSFFEKISVQADDKYEVSGHDTVISHNKSAAPSYTLLMRDMRLPTNRRKIMED